MTALCVYVAAAELYTVSFVLRRARQTEPRWWLVVLAAPVVFLPLVATDCTWWWWDRPDAGNASDSSDDGPWGVRGQW